MPALTATPITDKLPLGDKYIQFLSVTTGAAAAAADEYVNTGLGKVESVLVEPTRGTAPGVAATATITFAATDQTDEDNVTIDGTIYYLQSGTLDNVGGYDVLLSTTEATMAANLAAAINNTGVAGTNYGTHVAAHPTVKASAALGVVTLTARQVGAAGNAITLAKSSTNTSISGATLTGGRDAMVAAVNVVLNALGTGQAADSTPGALGIETTAASQTVRFAVLGRA